MIGESCGITTRRAGGEGQAMSISIPWRRVLVVSPLVAVVMVAAPGVAGERATPAAEGRPFPVAIRIDASKTRGEMKPVWRFFGHDEPNYTYMTDGKKLLTQLASLSPEPVYIRTHNLLTSGDGTPALKWGSTGVYSEDAQGRPRYDWTVLDRIFDTYRERGVRPYVQIGFMPEALSTHPVPYQHRWTPGGKESISTGWAYPPKDYEKWAELVFQWVKHSVERYGCGAEDGIESWYLGGLEPAEHPLLGGEHSRGVPARAYDYAADAVKRALPTARGRRADPTSPATKFVPGDEVPSDLPGALPSGRNHATGPGRFAAGFRGVPRQG